MIGGQHVIAVICVGICALGVFGVLLRISKEDKRLIERYVHIKAVMKRREEMEQQREALEELRRQQEEDERRKRAPNADILNEEMPADTKDHSGEESTASDAGADADAAGSDAVREPTAV